MMHPDIQPVIRRRHHEIAVAGVETPRGILLAIRRNAYEKETGKTLSRGTTVADAGTGLHMSAALVCGAAMGALAVGPIDSAVIRFGGPGHSPAERRLLRLGDGADPPWAADLPQRTREALAQAVPPLVKCQLAPLSRGALLAPTGTLARMEQAIARARANRSDQPVPTLEHLLHEAAENRRKRLGQLEAHHQGYWSTDSSFVTLPGGTTGAGIALVPCTRDGQMLGPVQSLFLPGITRSTEAEACACVVTAMYAARRSLRPPVIFNDQRWVVDYACKVAAEGGPPVLQGLVERLGMEALEALDVQWVRRRSTPALCVVDLAARKAVNGLGSVGTARLDLEELKETYGCAE